MPITLNCTCGKTLRVADEHAGRRVKCPACSAVISAPAPEPQFEVVEEPKQGRTPARPVARPVATDDEDDDRGYGMTKAEAAADPPKRKPNFRKRADDSDEDDDPPPRKGRRGSAAARAGADSGKRISYVIGGLVMIPAGIGLAIWGNSGEGRGATKMLIFGICLAIGGLITLVRGITGNISDDD